MTTTETVRSQGFLPLAGDIPEGLTIAQYRARRAKDMAGVSRPPRPRRRARRPVAAAS